MEGVKKRERGVKMMNGRWEGRDAEANAGYMRNKRTKSGKGSTSEADWVPVCLSKGRMMQRQVDDTWSRPSQNEVEQSLDTVHIHTPLQDVG